MYHVDKPHILVIKVYVLIKPYIASILMVLPLREKLKI